LESIAWGNREGKEICHECLKSPEIGHFEPIRGDYNHKEIVKYQYRTCRIDGKCRTFAAVKQKARGHK
jgi:hypothetical protein